MQKIPFHNQAIGHFIPSTCSEDNVHEFSLIINGEEVDSGYFPSMEIAKEKAKKYYSGDYEVRDKTMEEEEKLALCYRKEIKKARPSLKSSGIMIDMGAFYSDRFGYRVVPFFYKDKRYIYREEPSGVAWIDEYLE